MKCPNCDGRYGLINHPYLYLGPEIVTTNFLAGVDSGRSTLLVNATATITLPVASESKGRAFWIKNIHAGVVTVLPTAPDTIDGINAGGGGLSLPDQYDTALVVCDGLTAWYVLSFSNL